MVLYVEKIYQTMTNEPDASTTLEKIIVASGTKVAIGDTLREAITNLLSQSAVNIEVNTTEDIEGMIEAIINANKNLTESNKNLQHANNALINTNKNLTEKRDTIN